MKEKHTTQQQRRQDILVGKQKESILLDWQDDNVSVEQSFICLLCCWLVGGAGRREVFTMG